MSHWEFWIDVGGTFTDCLARSPEGKTAAFKTLSSGATKGRIRHLDLETNSFRDPLRIGNPENFWVGYQFTFSEHHGQSWTVTAYDASSG
ncbi:MAG TPA: hydantoinase/oxoprolinase N-terminal domain-containing protein, partial [Planctomycetaceae bacterium]|nr:hydantoinase/oxoprolinase N-terminal domain-containing protein [Planctomycetaceae bacterium]